MDVIQHKNNSIELKNIINYDNSVLLDDYDEFKDLIDNIKELQKETTIATYYYNVNGKEKGEWIMIEYLDNPNSEYDLISFTSK